MDEKQLLTAFEACELATADFPHREHVRVAWTMLREDPDLVSWNGGELLNRCYPGGEHRTEFAKRVFVLPGRPPVAPTTD